MLNAALSAGAGAITAVSANGSVVWQAWLLKMGPAFVSAISSDLGFHQPVSLASQSLV